MSLQSLLSLLLLVQLQIIVLCYHKSGRLGVSVPLPEMLLLRISWFLPVLPQLGDWGRSSLGDGGLQCDHRYVANVVLTVLWTQRDRSNRQCLMVGWSVGWSIGYGGRGGLKVWTYLRDGDQSDLIDVGFGLG